MSTINDDDDDDDLIDKNDYVVDNYIENDIYSIELNELFHQQQAKQQEQQLLHEKNDIITSYILSTLFILSTIIISTSIKVVHASTTITLFENINKISLSTSSSPLSLISLPNTPSDIFNPLNFQPVCPASDNFYQLLKSIINIIIGSENIVEYGPLIASVLLRVRLELCVFESFLYEAVIPFIKVKGITWILPLHETLETFIAGTIFAISSNFILVGSTKIFSIVLLYIDALIGLPIRLVSALLKRLPFGQPTSEIVGNALLFIANILSSIRSTIEMIDTFVGRYLVLSTTLYIIFKFVHFKFLNGIFP